MTGTRRLMLAFALGAVAGAVLGAIWGTLDYGTFDLGYLYNYVLGFGLMLGVVSAAVTGIVIWLRRNPLR